MTLHATLTSPCPEALQHAISKTVDGSGPFNLLITLTSVTPYCFFYLKSCNIRQVTFRPFSKKISLGPHLDISRCIMMPGDGTETITRLWVLFPIASYLLCAIPFGKIVGRGVAGMDITRTGSGNIGATNVTRELGLKWGILTLSLDVLKGFLSLSLFALFFPRFEIGTSLVALSALLGHQFSIYQGLKGGKGVATALGIYLAISPFPCLIALLFFLLIVYLWDFVSVGSILSAAIMPVLIFLYLESKVFFVLSLVLAALICLKHRDNIKRLMRREEVGWRKGRPMSDGREDGRVHHQSKNK